MVKVFEGITTGNPKVLSKFDGEKELGQSKQTIT